MKIEESLKSDKVKSSGYKPLINDGGSTTSDDTLKNTTTGYFERDWQIMYLITVKSRAVQ